MGLIHRLCLASRLTRFLFCGALPSQPALTWLVPPLRLLGCSRIRACSGYWMLAVAAALMERADGCALPHGAGRKGA